MFKFISKSLPNLSAKISNLNLLNTPVVTIHTLSSSYNPKRDTLSPIQMRLMADQLQEQTFNDHLNNQYPSRQNSPSEEQEMFEFDDDL